MVILQRVLDRPLEASHSHSDPWQEEDSPLITDPIVYQLLGAHLKNHFQPSEES